MMPVLHVCAFLDNYIWLIHGKSPDRVAIVDPGDALPVRSALDAQRLTPAAILCTHHHSDHVGGVTDLLAHFALPVYGPAREYIPAITDHLQEGDIVQLPELGLAFHILDVPGHTSGHIAYYGHGMLFCGDTLFSAGCGRLFEGTADELYGSLSKLAALPDKTAVYCAHEYTLSNLRFALRVEPDNQDAQRYYQEASQRRVQQLATLPSTIGLERRVNPFLRVAVPSVQAAAEKFAGGQLHSETEIFAALRRWKDGFLG